MILVGSEACARCGRAHGLLLVELENIHSEHDDRDVPECADCGDAVSQVAVWWSSALLPAGPREARR